MTRDRFSGIGQGVRELIEQRDLLILVCRRDILVKYRRSFLGLIWAVATPLLTALVMFVVFKTIFRTGTVGDWPYLAYILTGVGLFTWFSQGLLGITPSFRGNGSVLTRSAAAPEIFALSPVVSGLVPYVLTTILVWILLIFTGHAPTWLALGLIPTAMLIFLLTLGLGTLLSLLAVRFDDFTAAATILVTLLAYLTPTFYPMSIIPPEFRPIYDLNPLVGLLDLYRQCLGYPPQVDWPVDVYAAAVSIVAAVLGAHLLRTHWPRLVTEL